MGTNQAKWISPQVTSIESWKNSGIMHNFTSVLISYSIF